MARRQDGFHMEWDGLEELQEQFEEMRPRFVGIATEEYTDYGMLVEEGSKALVHHDTGDLEDSISFDKAKQIGNEIVLEGGSTSKYAWKRHETPYRMGVYPKYDNGAKIPDYYQNGLGAGTRFKPTWRGIRPGRKFMQNAINATQRDYEEMNQRILDRTLRGD